MNSIKNLFGITLALTGLAIIVWGITWGFSYLQGMLAPIDTGTMAMVVAAWIGLWGAAAIVAVGLRWAHGRGAKAERREARADVYGYVLDAWANAAVLGDVSPDASDSMREAQAEARATLRRAERHLTLHGSPNVIEAYNDLRAGTAPTEEALAALLTQMRRDVGQTTLTMDVEDLLDRPVGEAFSGDTVPLEDATGPRG